MKNTNMEKYAKAKLLEMKIGAILAILFFGFLLLSSLT